MKETGDARSVAAKVLQRFWRDDAYVAAALSAELQRSQLAAADAALATELSYGVARTEPYLRRSVERFGKIKASDQVTTAHLLIGAYQLEFLDRIPARAAVNEAVEAVRRERGSRVAGFVNATLRRVSEAHEQAPVSVSDAVLQSTPSWLRKRLVRAVGEEDALSLLVSASSPRPSLRGRPTWSPNELPTGIVPVEGCPEAFRFEAGGDPRKLLEFAEGRFVVQELGAQYVARALGVRPGERVLDVCAGRGQKTFQLIDGLAARGDTAPKVVATDLHEHKVSQLQAEAQRLELTVDARVHDWTTPPPLEFQQAFDAVLVDAPCTGVGTLRRRPEIARRLGAEDPARMAELQVTILRHATEALAEGGRIVFATCSVLLEEGEGVLEQVADLVEPTVFEAQHLPPEIAPGSGSFRLLPRLQGTDGYFVAMLQRRGKEVPR